MAGQLQWLVLRQHLIRASWWVGASTVGLGVGCAAGIVVLSIVSVTIAADSIGNVSSRLVMALTWAVVGGGVGYLQSQVLRRYFDRVGWWVAASSAGFALGA